MQYLIDKIKNEVSKNLQKQIGEKINPEMFCYFENGLGLPLFKFAKKNKKNPQEFAENIAKKIKSFKYFSKIEAKHGYLNFIFKNKIINKEVFFDFQKLGNKYGQSKAVKDETIVIDYSAPNIGKPFSVGHLRSTIIGQALYNILVSQGYKVIGDNHIGDWGTQFGKLLCAYHLWGDKTVIAKNPIKELLNLYVKFHKESEKKPILKDDARKWFKRLEGGDKEARNIWKWMRNISLDEFNRIYDMLGVKIDKVLGESFYEDKMPKILEELENKNIVKWIPALDEKGKKTSEKVLAIDLKKEGIKLPLLLKKSDGTTLYATRDLATAKYRIDTWNPDKIIYVVGSEQILYFRQLFIACKMMNFDSDFIHLSFGLIRMSEGKMSTRLGRVVFLEDVLNEGISHAMKIIKDRDWSEFDKEQIAKIIGIGAIKYADLSQDKKHNIIFDWNRILNLKGNSGPYLQYQFVRMQSILQKANFDEKAKTNPELLDKNEEIRLIKLVMHYNEVLKQVSKNYEVHNLANYLYEIATEFSRFYEKVPVLKAENEELKATRLYLCFMCSQILKSGLNLLGIEVPEKM